jgi:hypothetical protein
MPECPSYDGVPSYGGPCWSCRGEEEHCPLGPLHPGSLWDHFKGDRYLVLKVGTNTKDGKAEVIYRKWPADANPARTPWANVAATDPSVEWYTRPLAEWYARENGEPRFVPAEKAR